MKRLIFIAIVLLSIVSCKKQTTTENSKTDSTVFNKVLEDYNEGTFRLYPLNATFAGDYRFNDKLPNYLANEFKEQEKAFFKQTIENLNQFDDKQLTDSEKLSKAVLIWECNINLERLQFNNDLTPIDQMWTQQLTIGQLASGTSAQPFNTLDDYNNWLKRVDAYIIWLDSAQKKMEEGIKTGYVLPKSLIVKVIPQFEDLTTGKPQDHIFYKPATNIPDTFSKNEKQDIEDSYLIMVRDKIIPAYKKMTTFLKEVYLPAGRESSGVGELSNGLAYYQHQIKTYTTTDMTADEIHQLGLNEVARISKEMEKVKQTVGFEGNLIEFFDYVRENKDLMPFNKPQQVIDNFNTIYETMQPQLNVLFNKKPKTPFEVKRVEAFREASSSAHYNPGTIDGTKPGVFYVPIPDVKTYNTFADEALFLHEAIPGHHYQISLTQESEELPEFRKTLWYSSYGEGWALYTESLGKELGLYTDPYQYFGMLSMEMHRAIRLVVDTGIHTKGWSREQAIQYSLENEAEPEESIEKEIERYMANPGQALSYKIGQLKIIELRSRAAMKLGEKFDIKQFHDEVLETGCIPLNLLESKINLWIDQELSTKD